MRATGLNPSPRVPRTHRAFHRPGCSSTPVPRSPRQYSPGRRTTILPSWAPSSRDRGHTAVCPLSAPGGPEQNLSSHMQGCLRRPTAGKPWAGAANYIGEILGSRCGPRHHLALVAPPPTATHQFDEHDLKCRQPYCTYNLGTAAFRRRELALVCVRRRRYRRLP